MERSWLNDDPDIKISSNITNISTPTDTKTKKKFGIDPNHPFSTSLTLNQNISRYAHGCGRQTGKTVTNSERGRFSQNNEQQSIGRPTKITPGASFSQDSLTQLPKPLNPTEFYQNHHQHNSQPNRHQVRVTEYRDPPQSSKSQDLFNGIGTLQVKKNRNNYDNRKKQNKNEVIDIEDENSDESDNSNKKKRRKKKNEQQTNSSSIKNSKNQNNNNNNNNRSNKSQIQNENQQRKNIPKFSLTEIIKQNNHQSILTFTIY